MAQYKVYIYENLQDALDDVNTLNEGEGYPRGEAQNYVFPSLNEDTGNYEIIATKVMGEYELKGVLTVVNSENT